MTSSIKHGGMIAFIAICLLVISIFTIFSVGPMVEGKFKPVIVETAVTNARFDPETNSVRFGVYGRKARECRLLGLVAQVEIDGVWHRGEVYFEEEGTGKLIRVRKSRPKGDQIWDQYQVFPTGDTVRITLLEDCHPFWVTVEPFVEFDVPQKEAP